MFRLWVVGSVVFVVAVAVFSYAGIREEFRIANTDWDAMAKEAGGVSLVPVFCSDARGVAGQDYTTSNDLCWYGMDSFRKQYPEYKDVNDKVLSEKLYVKVGQPLQHLHPWRKVMAATAVAFGYPLAVFILGYSLSWAFAGFRSSPTHKENLT
jgi:hypothetical protein